MTTDVGQCFHDDAVHRCRRLPGQGRNQIGVQVQFNRSSTGTPVTIEEFGQVLDSGKRRARGCSYPGFQITHHLDGAVHRRQRLSSVALDLLQQAARRLGIRIEQHLGSLRPDHHRTDVVGHEIMQIGGQSETLGAMGVGDGADPAGIQPAQVTPRGDREQTGQRPESADQYEVPPAFVHLAGDRYPQDGHSQNAQRTGDDRQPDGTPPADQSDQHHQEQGLQQWPGPRPGALLVEHPEGCGSCRDQARRNHCGRKPTNVDGSAA